VLPQDSHLDEPDGEDLPPEGAKRRSRHVPEPDRRVEQQLVSRLADAGVHVEILDDREGLVERSHLLEHRPRERPRLQGFDVGLLLERPVGDRADPTFE